MRGCQPLAKRGGMAVTLTLTVRKKNEKTRINRKIRNTCNLFEPI